MNLNQTETVEKGLKNYEKIVLAFSSGTNNNNYFELIFKKIKETQYDKVPLYIGFNDYIERLILDSHLWKRESCT